MTDDPIDELQWMAESDLARRRRAMKERDKRLFKQRVAVFTVLGVLAAMSLIALVLV